MTSNLTNISQLSKMSNKISSPSNSYISNEINDIKIFGFTFILVGEVNVGKTSIANRFVDKMFKETYKSTIEISFKKYDLRLSNDILINISIYDTMGQERYKSLTKNYYRNSNGIFLVFDLTDLNSFNNIENWLNEINNSIDNSKILILVGNKSDDIENRKVEKEEIEKISLKFNVKYLEVSAKNGNNIDLLFETMSWDCYKNIQENYDNNNNNNNNNNKNSFLNNNENQKKQIFSITKNEENNLNPIKKRKKCC